MLKVIETREIVAVVVMFLIVQFAGFLVASLTVYTSNVNIVIGRLTSPATVDLSYAIDAVLISVLLLMLLNRHKRHGGEIWNHRLFLAFESCVIVATAFFAFLFFLTIVLPPGLQWTYLFIALGASLLLIVLKIKTHMARNATWIISSIGVGLVLGFYLNFKYAIIALAFLALYDYVAVFVTKAMTKVAEKLADEDMIFLVNEEDLEAIPEKDVSAEEVAAYLSYLHETKEDKDPLFKKLLSFGRLPVITQIEIGEGDLGLPLMAAVSIYSSFQNLFVALFTICGGAIGLMAAFWFLKRYKTPLPAIPPLFSFIAISSGISLRVEGYISTSLLSVFVAAGILVLVFGMVLTLSRMRKRHVI
ncbi:MAG: hypothetical protein KGH72_02225 [Candidatus Micrarchaeota archaeon]|nr:hypothetical protein [Candidatus Micrarchaeota archaeon]